MKRLWLERWRAFKRRPSSYIALLLLLALFGISLFAELLANEKPLLVSFQGMLYTPLWQDYDPVVFGQQDTFLVDWRLLAEQATQAGEGDWVLTTPLGWGPYESDPALLRYPAPPSAAHPLGTDDKGRDLLARLLYGFRLSMVFALSVWLLSFTIGIGVGAVQGYLGGAVDFYGQRFNEIWSAVPVFFLILILIAVFTPSLLLLIAVMSLFGWPLIAQYLRAEFLHLRRSDFVEAARALGASPWRIMFLHILPNGITPLVTFTPFTIAGGITGIAALDYLGFGVPPPTPSWGELLRQALSHFTTAWWIALYTVGSMFTVLLLLVFINEGVREAFDPRQRKR